MSSQRGAPGTPCPRGTCRLQLGGTGSEPTGLGPAPRSAARSPRSPEGRPSRDDVRKVLDPVDRCHSLQNDYTRVHADRRAGTLGLRIARKKRGTPPPPSGRENWARGRSKAQGQREREALGHVEPAADADLQTMCYASLTPATCIVPGALRPRCLVRAPAHVAGSVLAWNSSAAGRKGDFKASRG